MEIVGPCCKCKAEFCIPDALYEAAKHSPSISFWCPYGHEQHFPAGLSEAERLRQERDRLQQRIAQKEDEAAHEREQREAAERRASAARGQVTKLKNRAAKGVCPCCNRRFTNLERHMTTKHPDFSNVVSIEKASA